MKWMDKNRPSQSVYVCNRECTLLIPCGWINETDGYPSDLKLTVNEYLFLVHNVSADHLATLRLRLLVYVSIFVCVNLCFSSGFVDLVDNNFSAKRARLYLPSVCLLCLLAAVCVSVLSA